jgi:hypothetical protein
VAQLATSRMQANSLWLSQEAIDFRRSPRKYILGAKSRIVSRK